MSDSKSKTSDGIFVTHGAMNKEFSDVSVRITKLEDDLERHKHEVADIKSVGGLVASIVAVSVVFMMICLAYHDVEINRLDRVDGWTSMRPHYQPLEIGKPRDDAQEKTRAQRFDGDCKPNDDKTDFFRDAPKPGAPVRNDRADDREIVTTLWDAGDGVMYAMTEFSDRRSRDMFVLTNDNIRNGCVTRFDGAIVRTFDENTFYVHGEVVLHERRHFIYICPLAVDKKARVCCGQLPCMTPDRSFKNIDSHHPAAWPDHWYDFDAATRECLTTGYYSLHLWRYI